MTTSRKSSKKAGLLRVGELARAVGKTVRAIHLYEELGLVRPAMRTEGRFRMYTPDAVARIGWIVKLQAIGFTLSEIQGFVSDFEDSPSGREATSRVREVFKAKQAAVRRQMTQLQVIDNDLEEALNYLDVCDACSPQFTPTECKSCGHHGHERGAAPQLFAGISRKPTDDFDVAVDKLRKEGSH